MTKIVLTAWMSLAFCYSQTGTPSQSSAEFQSMVVKIPPGALDSLQKFVESQKTTAADGKEVQKYADIADLLQKHVDALMEFCLDNFPPASLLGKMAALKAAQDAVWEEKNKALGRNKPLLPPKLLPNSGPKQPPTE